MFQLVCPEHFNLRTIMNSGQCFRIFELEHNVFDVLSMNMWVRVYYDEPNDTYTFDCLNDDDAYWLDYFDMLMSADVTYQHCFAIINNSNDDFLKSAATYSSGMRILRQDYWETLVSFIISQNNNIPRIKKSIEALCKKFGKPMTKYGITYYSFPRRAEVNHIKLEDLADLGLGYRDKYIYNICTCSPHLLAPSYENLLTLPGIGPKVASCIMLFGAHDLTQCPIDTWMKKVLSEVYNNKFDFTLYAGFEGYVQQLMFYYYRNLHKRT